MGDNWPGSPAPRPTQALGDLARRGAVITNGYRTDDDYFRLKAAGYTPARNGGHPRGDAVDLAPGGQFRTLGDLVNAARQEFGPSANVSIHNGTHVHADIPGWGGAPDVTRPSTSGWPGVPANRAAPVNTGEKQVSPQARANASTALTPLSLTGQAHDGDTVGLTNGRNGRLFGFDAFELNQQGRKPDGSIVPLGEEARDYMLGRIGPGTAANPTGAMTYGRPVVNLSGDPMTDPAHDALRLGYGVATPEYLRGTDRLGPYIEAQRLARQNGLGGYATNAETPSQFRHKDGAWQGQAPGAFDPGSRMALFPDERDPNDWRRGYSDNQLSAYHAAAERAKTVDELLASAKELGINVPADAAKAYIEARNKGAHGGPGFNVIPLPRPTINPGDGAFGAYARGLGDPINALDELGGFADAAGLTPGRENIWNSDRRWADIWGNNVDQNRAILDHDEEAHAYARLSGQLTSGVALPMGAASTPVRLGAMMAGEGGLAGFMSGEGGFTDRLPNTALGAGIGAVAGPLLGLAGEHILAPAASRIASRFRGSGAALGDVAQEAAYEAMPVINDGLQSAGPTPAARTQPQGGATAAMAMERGPEIVGRPRDVIDVGSYPGKPIAPEAPFGQTRNMAQPLNAEEVAKLSDGVRPQDVLPRPANEVRTLADAVKAKPSRFELLQAPNERNALPVLKVGSPTNLAQTSTRRDIYDVTKMLRRWGGVRDDGGDLAHMGITNAPRKGLPFGGNEQFIGKLVNPDGMSLDEAGEKLWEAGYFRERPTTSDLLDVLRDESVGNSHYHPEDLQAVDEFHRLQDQRNAIESAAYDGSPLAEDRSHSVTLDDLVANTPPAEAYADAPRLTGKVGNINLDRLERPEQVSQLIDHISKRVGGFDAAARGKITHEETRALAQEIGVKPEELLRRQAGQALNAEQLYAARALVQRSRETVVRLAKKATTGSDEDKLAFRKAWLKHAALEEQISGATAEAGRALSQFRMAAKAGDAGAEAVRAYLKGGGGKESIDDAAQAIVDLMEDPAKASHFIRESVKPTWRDKFNELWINSLLSGPKTHVVNFVGNAVTTLGSFPELAATAAIGKLTRSGDRALFGEVKARAAGLADSSVDALRAMRTAFKTGEPLDDVAKVEANQHEAIGGTLGKVIRTPTRALTAADEFWKSLLSHAEIRQAAYRHAQKAGGTPEEIAARYAELTRNPTPEMVKASKEAARYWTFQKELGPTGKHVQGISNNWILGKLIIPFVRTPSNIIKFAGERSAFALAMPEVRAALRAGGRARDEALAKITLGSGLSTAAAIAALQGRLTGSGPSDPQKRAALLQSGWQPNSIRIGDRWVSYDRLDPVSTLFGVAADFAEAGKWATKKEADQLALNLALGVAKNLTNKTWLSGLSDAFDVLSDPDRYGKRYVQKLAGSMAVPALLAQTEQATDPHLKDARSIIDAIKARVPVLSNSVPDRLNVWGEPVSRGDAVGPDIISPLYASQISSDPVNKEIARLQAPLSMPQRSFTVGKQKVELTPQQYAEFVQLAGKSAKAALAQEMRSPEWKQMGDDEKRDAVKETLTDMRDAARQEMRSRYPELSAKNDDRPSGTLGKYVAQRPGASAVPPLPASSGGWPGTPASR